MTTDSSPNRPEYGTQVLFKRMETRLSWDDLVLAPEVMDEVQLICEWMKHGRQLLANGSLSQQHQPGYRVLFYGLPGTGKTLTASLIAKAAGVDIYRVDMSEVISKYTDETEKNLNFIFDQATAHNWVLFFDQSDALFCKRTTVSEAHDRYTNQAIAYLQQRIEDFAGLTILSSNMPGNSDDVYTLRLQSTVYFPMPDAQQRLRLWQSMLGENKLASDVILKDLSEIVPLAGGDIVNVIRHAALHATKSGRSEIGLSELNTALCKFLGVEGRTL